MGALARRERFATVMFDPTASGSLVITELRFLKHLKSRVDLELHVART
jgi:hypothetical protein